MTTSRASRWRRVVRSRESVRFRTTVLALGIVAIALTAGGIALLAVLRHSLNSSGDDVARARALAVAALARAGDLPRVVQEPNEDDIVQVVDAGRHVVSGTLRGGSTPIATFVPTGATPVVRTVTDVPDGPEHDAHRVWALRAGTDGGPAAVYIAHPDSTDWPETARLLAEDSELMERLVRDLLFLARDDHGKSSAPRSLIDLDDVVLDEAARLRSHDSVRIETAGVSAAPVVGNRGDLARLVRNLVDNAVSHAASAVRLTLTTKGCDVSLTVEDDGPGVALEERARVFDCFYRCDGARGRAEGGTGLGLAIAQAIAEQHDGVITIENAELGARFVVVLPAQHGRAHVP